MSDPEKLAIRSTSEYASEPWNIDLRISVNVSAIDFQNKTVMFDGGEEKYDHLIVATGASPRTLPVEGGNLEGVLKLRTVADAKMVDEGEFARSNVALRRYHFELTSWNDE
jgi:NADPH-dependent 2,4-dienoyl-CoA reductase/sulfur reductase-like enzyme